MVCYAYRILFIFFAKNETNLIRAFFLFLLLHSGKTGRIALTVAVQNGDTEVTEILLREGASPWATDDMDESGLTYAARAGRSDLLRLMLETHKGSEDILGREPLALNAAAEDGKLDSVRFLLEKGADASQVNSSGRGALVLAIVKGHVDVVSELLNGGADPNAGAVVPHAKTPLIASSSRLYGSSKIALMLVEAGAKVNMPAKGGWTALMQATLDGIVPVMQILMDNGADPKQEDDNGKSALSLAKQQYTNPSNVVHAVLAGEKVDMREEDAVWKQVNQQ
jgi:uncharacterized protein